MMADSQVSVGGALSYAWALLSQNWRAIWGALALNALAWTVVVAGLLATNLGLLLAGFVGILLTKYPLYGAVVRASSPSPGAPPAAGAGPTHLGLQWRMPEFRMLGSDALLWAFQVIMVMLIGVVLLAPVVGVAMSAGVDPSKIKTMQDLFAPIGRHASDLMQAEAFAFWLLLAVIGLRLSLALVASAECGRVVLLSSWALTRGHFWRIAAATFLVSLPLSLALTVTGATAPLGTPQAVTPGEIFTYALLTGVLAGGATTPLLAGVQLYFYRRLGPVPERVVRGSV
jgi:hypothetical protein